ncbi:hypothetical protein QUF70_12500 [Desulfobacterales bacterium HSG17]|nr:hypothetical protein [Desulfobacterales bacterium HSG17]
MSALKKYEMLDNEAENLYLELEGIDTQYNNGQDEDLESNQENTKESDAQKLVLIEIAHLISTYLQDARFLEGVKNKKDSFEDFITAIGKIVTIPGHDGNFFINYRGYPTGTKTPAELDYVIKFANYTIDSTGAAAIFSRAGVSMVHLQGRISKAFKVFSDNGISTLCLKIPGSKSEITKEYREQLRVSLNIISHYNNSLKSGTPIIFEKNGNKVFQPLALDEQGAADINLTLVAGLNSLKPQTVKSLVNQVGTWIQKPENDNYVSVYDAISDIKSLRGKLSMPEIEVNNIRWLSLDKNHTVISKKKARISRLAVKQFKNSPQNAVRAIQTVYGDDYSKISSDNLGDRVKIATDLLNNANTGSNNQGIEKEILTNIHERFHEINDDVFDDLIISKDVLRISTDKQETIVGKVHSKMRGIINFHKKRAAVTKKMKNITDKSINFDARDYESIAKTFDVSVKNAEKLVTLLKACFDNNGYFLRKVFEKHIPVFVKFEGKIFRFMWYYLKQTPRQNDRITFLNSLQLLIAKMKNPQNAIDLLLTDIMSEPGKVDLSDRNAFMLGNILLRTYNKEINVDIEVTPEEVLIVQDGLNRDVAKEMADKIDLEQDSFLEKTRAIHTKLMESLASEESTNVFDPRFLLYLERELFIFLSLTGGETSCSVLRSAVKRYSDPDSEIYALQNSNEYIGALIQHLTVAIRGLERVGNQQDAVILENLKQNEQKLMFLCSDSGCINKVKRMMHWADKALNSVNAR